MFFELVQYTRDLFAGQKQEEQPLLISPKNPAIPYLEDLGELILTLNACVEDITQINATLATQIKRFSEVQDDETTKKIQELITFLQQWKQENEEQLNAREEQLAIREEQLRIREEQLRAREMEKNIARQEK